MLQGYACASDLLSHPRWRELAGNVLDLIRSQRVEELQVLGAGVWELVSYFEPVDILFLAFNRLSYMVYYPWFGQQRSRLWV